MCFIVLLFFSSCFAQEVSVTDKYFNTQYLANYDQVARDLIAQEQFNPITFPAQDGTELLC